MASLTSIVNGSAGRKEKGASFNVIMVHYSKLIPSEDNNYSTDNIRELANMIRLSGGIKQNLLARKRTPDEYELIAGHRRRLAVKYLVEDMGLEEFAMVPVHVEKDGDLLSEVNLILTNAGARERTDWEKLMEVERLSTLLKAMQTGSEEEQQRFCQLCGKTPGIGSRELRKVIAEMLGLSETKVANLNHINNKLSPELKERFQAGEIGVSVANEAAGLSPEDQKELAEKEEIRIADVKEKKSVSAVSDSDTAKEAQIPGQTEIEEFLDPEEGKEKLSAYGTLKKLYPEGSLIASESCEGGHCCFSCAMECEIRGENRYCREAPMGQPFPCEILICGLQNQRDGAGDQCQFINHDLAEHCAGSGEADPCCKNCKDPCEYICARAMRKLDTEPENTQPESQGEMEQKLDESWNIGDLPQASERYLRRLAQVLVSEMGNRMIVPGEIARLSEETVKRKVNILGQETGGEIDIGEGITAYPCEEIIEFYAGEDDLGVCSYGRFATQVRKVMENWSPEGSNPDSDTVSESDTTDHVDDKQSSEPELAGVEEPLEPCQNLTQQEEENSKVLQEGRNEPDGVMSESDTADQGTQKIKIFDKAILEAMIADTVQTLEVMQTYWMENQPDIYTKHVMQLQAYKMLLESHGEEE